MIKIAILLFALTLSTSIEAQTVTLGPTTKLAYCVGDTLSAAFSASGSFAKDNFFVLQLSDGNGSFNSPTDGAQSASLSGTLAVVLKSTGSHYRVRIASTDPYVTSSTIDSNISVSSYPSPQLIYSTANGTISVIAGTEGDPVHLFDATNEGSGATYFWSFNEDAEPKNSMVDSTIVMYPTAGFKDGTLTVTNSAGCNKTIHFTIKILGCNPVIPQNVHIVTSSETGYDSIVWVKAAGSYTAGENNVNATQIIFAEPGSAITAGRKSMPLIYLKTGATFTDNGADEAIVVLNSGNVLTFNPNWSQPDTFYCSNLTFDYSQVQAGVAENPPPSNLTILQSGDHLYANDEGLPIEIRISNILGTEVLSEQSSGALDVDLSALPAGVYFAVIEAGNDRAVKRIAVVH